MYHTLVMILLLNLLSHDLIEGSAAAQNVPVKTFYLLLQVVSDSQAHFALKFTVCVVQNNILGFDLRSFHCALIVVVDLLF
jgi:hypothetical protein